MSLRKIVTLKNVYKYQIFTLICSLILLSCNKEEKLNTSGEALVQVNLLGVDAELNSDILNSSQKSARLDVGVTPQLADDSQTVVLKLDSKYEIIATLQPETTSSNKSSLKAGDGKKAEVTKVITPLQNNVKYRVIVFETATGNFKSQAQYVARNEASNVLALDAGKEYTFISYSYGTVADIPAINNSANLNTFSLQNISGNANFMISKSNILLKFGTNNLDIKMKQQLSEITTSITSFITKSGVVQNIVSASASILPHYDNLAIKFSNLNTTYSNLATNGKQLQFASLGTKTIKANSTILCSPLTGKAIFKISSINIGGVIKQDVTLPEITIKPGVKYNLDLEVKTLDDGVIIGNKMWAYGNLIQDPVGGGPSSSSSYTFAKSPELRGSYFISNTWNAVERVTLQTPSPTGVNVIDPCSRAIKADPTGLALWRTPSEADLQSLRDTKHVSGTYNGVWGMYFGTDVVPSISNRDKYLFLPIHGYLYYNLGSLTNNTDGSYWSFGSAANIPRLFFNQNNNLVTVSNQPRMQAHQIRCIKNLGGL